MPARAASLPNGTMLGRYRLDRCIGSGGMGEVYEALHTGLKKRVAVKVLRLGESADETARARFLREGENASRIRHPNVVDITDVGEEDGQPFLVMELLEGQPLSARLKAGPLPVTAAVAIVVAACAAVSAAHREGIIHRDLKPDNIFLARSAGDNVITKVLDFGISKSLDQDVPELTMTSSFLGSPYYVSPEQARGEKNIDVSSDQYALGVILFEALSGVRPHHEHGDTLMALMHAVAAGKYTPLAVVNPDVPDELAQIVQKAMSTDPEERFDSVREFGAALMPFAPERAQQKWGTYFEDIDASPPSSASQATTFDLETTEDLLSPTIADSGPMQPTLEGTAASARPTVKPAARGRWLAAAALLASVGAGAWVFVARQQAPSATDPAANPSGTSIASGAVVEPAESAASPGTASPSSVPASSTPAAAKASAPSASAMPVPPAAGRRPSSPAVSPTTAAKPAPTASAVPAAPPIATAPPTATTPAPAPTKTGTNTDNIDPWAQ